VLFRGETLAGIAAGEIDLAFRRWPRARVKAGTQLRTAIGVLEVVAVDVVDPRRIGTRDAGRAGYASREALVAALDEFGSGDVHRIRLRRGGADPRIALRERAALSADERAELERRLERMAGGRELLALIAARPGVRAADLAASVGRELRPFKVSVRRLKELGLTESLEVGYRLSPRGRALQRAAASAAKG
jgi:hypothetical protein